MSDLGVRGGVHINPLFGGSAQELAQQPKLAPEQYKASHGMLSGQELMDKMGAPPKSDVTVFGKTIKSNSTAYKGALEHLQNYQSQVDTMSDRNLDRVPKGVIDSMQGELRAVIKSADDYLAKHADGGSKTDRRGVMQELKEAAQAELQNLGNLSKMTGTKDKDINVAEGLVLLRGGITDASHFTRDLNDSLIDTNNSRMNFGAGKVNSVELIDYSGEVRVVKYMSKEAEKLMMGERESGMDQKDMRTAARNIATANVAEFFEMDHLVPMPDIILRDGQAALAMKKAPGESLIQKIEVKVSDQNEVKRYEAELKSYQNNLALGKTTIAQNFLENLERAGVRKDQNGDWQKKVAAFKEIPYDSKTNPKLAASVQEGLLDLQALHCLLGQVDGQPENIYVQVKGDKAVVTGIDQDMCLGEKMTGLDSFVGNKPIGDLGKTYGGPPPLMSQNFYDKLMAMTDKDLDQLLGPQITDQEKSAAKSRLALLQEHAGKLEKAGLVIDKFEGWTGKDPKSGKTMGVFDFCAASDFRSYIKRDSASQAKAAHKLPLDMAKHV